MAGSIGLPVARCHIMVMASPGKAGRYLHEDRLAVSQPELGVGDAAVEAEGLEDRGVRRDQRVRVGEREVGRAGVADLGEEAAVALVGELGGDAAPEQFAVVDEGLDGELGALDQFPRPGSSRPARRR
ncbi:hypothetical protein Shyd_57680 [Streptomyces hydrogenans]|uniref:Uncharacterized protein n=1 Tax=Streptomyces hydrogenans TaxID=1873719 RepID=A0ABQ3PH88_9ACTN|nr:hypothetical protein Shyd_57680 [Streptomyces hydrogenans]